MNADLQAVEDARAAGEFDTARQRATAYVNAHPDEFTEYAAMTEAAASDQAAIDQVVADVSYFREQGRLESQYRAEAWHLHFWDPQQIGGVAGPQRRDHRLEPAAPQRRTHK